MPRDALRASASYATRGDWFRAGGPRLLVDPRMVALTAVLVGATISSTRGISLLAWAALVGFLAGWASAWSP